MGGSSAPVASNGQTTTSQNSLQNYVSSQQSPQAQAILSQYSSGGMSLNDALKAMGGITNATSTGTDPNGAVNQNGFQTSGYGGTQLTNTLSPQGGTDALFTDPQTAGLAASSQVQSNPLYQGIFGQNGLQGQSENNYTNATGNLAQDRQALSGNDSSYGLQQSDLAAYGQGADQIGRQSAMQGQGIAQALAQRGLGSGSNGAAIASYAGNYGNQAEQLAGLQNQISQNRINTAQQLATARNASDLSQQQSAGNLALGTGQLGESAYGQQLNSNLAGAQNNYNELAGAAGSALNNQTGQQNINNEQYAQQQQGGLGSVLGGIAGGALGGLTGGLGTGLGTSLGKTIGGSTTGSPASLSSSI